MKDVSNLTGASNYGGRFSVSEITFNGDSGEFFYRHKDTEKGEDGKYAKENIGKTIDIVVMKIRRKLSKFAKAGGGMSTNEHNIKTDFVVLYGVTPQDKGTAEDIRTRHQELRTQQMVYCYFPAKKEVVRLVVKGSSLGSEAKHPKEVKKFYDYLQTFKGSEHIHEFFTKLVPVSEEGPKGTYYAMSFQRGAKLTDVQQEKVNEQIEDIHNTITAQDASFMAKFSRPGVAVEENVIQMDGEEEEPPAPSADLTAKEFPAYPEEDINPEDIPF